MPPLPTALALACALVLPITVVGHGLPAGFEDLAVGQVEQLEIRLYGRSAGLSPVMVTLDSATLTQPEAVLTTLGLSAQAQQVLLPSARRAHPRNSQLACARGRERLGCGHLSVVEGSDTLQMILDEAEGVLHLFMDTRWLPAIDPVKTRFHQTYPGASSALFQQHMINASGSRNGRNVTMHGRTVAGILERSHVVGEWNASQWVSPDHSATDLTLESLYYRQDLGDSHYAQFGLMDRRNLSSGLGGNFAFTMLPLDRLVGLRMGTTNAYRNSDAMADASPLTVLLARNARVDVLEGERLLETYYLPAGINTLDTQRLPAGSYLLTLRIYEDGHLARTEEAAFTKGASWVGDSVEWFVQSGATRGRQHRHGNGLPVTQLGARIPLGKTVGLTLGAAQVDSTSYGETRLDVRQMWGAHELRASAVQLHGSDGSRGSDQQLSYRKGISVSVLRQQRRSAVCTQHGVAYDTLGCTDSLTSSVSGRLLGGTAYFGYTDRTSRRLLPPWSDDGQPQWQQLPPSLPNMAAESQRQRSWQLSFTRAGTWKNQQVSVSTGLWRQRIAEGGVTDRGVYVNLGMSRIDRRSDGSLQRRLALDTRQPKGSTADVGITATDIWRKESALSSHEYGVSLSARRNGERTIDASRYSDTSWGSSGLALTWLQGRGQDALIFSLSHSSGFSFSRYGMYWMSAGLAGAGAGLLFQVDGAEDVPSNALAAELEVSGARAHGLRFGESRLFPLDGYQRHQAELQDPANADAAITVKVANSGGISSVFLPPGKVAAIPVSLQLTYTYVGNAMDVHGRGISGARVLNAPAPAIDIDGGFILELPGHASALYLLKGSQLLRCPMQVRERRSVALVVGDVTCVPMDIRHLPVVIQRQAHVRRLLRDMDLAIAPYNASAGTLR